MPDSPYRAARPPLRDTCDQCGHPLADGTPRYEGRNGSSICKACFFGQYDLLALFGLGALIAGAVTGSGALLVCGLVIPALGAYAIHRGGI